MIITDQTSVTGQAIIGAGHCLYNLWWKYVSCLASLLAMSTVQCPGTDLDTTPTQTPPTPTPACARPDKAAKAENWEQGEKVLNTSCELLTRSRVALPIEWWDCQVRLGTETLRHEPCPLANGYIRQVRDSLKTPKQCKCNTTTNIFISLSCWCQEYNLYSWSIGW